MSQIIIQQEEYPTRASIKHLDEVVNISRKSLKVKNSPYKHLKDSCPVFDGKIWHMFGTADKKIGGGHIEMLHAISNSSEGPWSVLEAVKHNIEGPCICAPGVAYDFDESVFYMFVHTDFVGTDTKIECLKSVDGGHNFFHVNTVLQCDPLKDIYRIYDPHPAIVRNQKFIVFTAVNKFGEYRLELIKSENNKWNDNWISVGTIMSESHVSFHGQPGMPGREWGIEGGQLVEMPNGTVMLNAVCFLPESEYAPPGKKQRFFLAMAENVEGPYKVMAPVISPTPAGWESGENGHATAIIENDEIKFFYHARASKGKNPRWRYGIAGMPIQSVMSVSI